MSFDLTVGGIAFPFVPECSWAQAVSLVDVYSVFAEYLSHRGGGLRRRPVLEVRTRMSNAILLPMTMSRPASPKRHYGPTIVSDELIEAEKAAAGASSGAASVRIGPDNIEL